METTLDFVNGNTRRCLFSMALPLIAAMFLNMAYNLVDSLWIGNLLGETAYAALTNSTPIILILSALPWGIQRHFHSSFPGGWSKRYGKNGKPHSHFPVHRPAFFGRHHGSAGTAVKTSADFSANSG